MDQLTKDSLQKYIKTTSEKLKYQAEKLDNFNDNIDDSDIYELHNVYQQLSSLNQNLEIGKLLVFVIRYSERLEKVTKTILK